MKIYSVSNIIIFLLSNNSKYKSLFWLTLNANFFFQIRRKKRKKSKKEKGERKKEKV